MKYPVTLSGPRIRAVCDVMCHGEEAAEVRRRMALGGWNVVHTFPPDILGQVMVRFETPTELDVDKDARRDIQKLLD